MRIRARKEGFRERALLPVLLLRYRIRPGSKGALAVVVEGAVVTGIVKRPRRSQAERKNSIRIILVS